MSKLKTRGAFGYNLRCYNLTLGYAIFYAVIFAGLTLAVSRVFASTSFSFGIVAPEFLYSSHLGLLYIYNIIVIPVYAVVTIIFPVYLQLPELDNNRWYVYSKFGISASSLAVSKFMSALVGILRIYIIGFALTFLISLAVLGATGLSIVAIGLTLAVGILSVLITMCPLFLLGSFSHGKFIMSLGVIVMSGLLAFILYYNGYLSPESYDTVLTSTKSLVSLSPTGLLLMAVAFAVICIPLSVSISGKRSASYNIEELDSDTLVALDVRSDILILEKGRKGYNVAISGPRVNDSDVDIPVPELFESRDER